MCKITTLFPRILSDVFFLYLNKQTDKLMHISKNDYAFCKSYQQVVTVMAAIADIAAA